MPGENGGFLLLKDAKVLVFTIFIAHFLGANLRYLLGHCPAPCSTRLGPGEEA
jgi:hypothetical protein